MVGIFLMLLTNGSFILYMFWIT